ncbi:hypothetical protein [Microcoleus sp. herbarium14]|uniref:hypothetical protein n=1 Tax=Microcoleus sp. herbarium14 TaxID=3055439 RepID=UPI002FD0B423
MIAKNTKVKTKVKKDANDSREVIVNIAKIIEQSPKPEAKELKSSNRTLDIVNLKIISRMHSWYSEMSAK